MVDYDPVNQNTTGAGKLVNEGGAPSIAALKAAISGSAVSAKYPALFMHKATRNDLIHVCRIESIAVAGLPGV